MSFNGSGTFVINSSGQPVVANTVISSTVFNALTADLATGLSTCITKDGQTTPTANIPMGTFKFTNLGNGSAATDSATLGQVQASTTKLVTVTGTDTITGTMTPALTAYASGQMFYFVAGGANTGAVTLNIDGLGARNVTRHGSVALVAGDILSGEVCVVVYDGTRFQLLNPASYTNLNVTGVLSLAAGTALLPSLAFSGDPNTGLWSPAADTLAASTGGLERLRVDSSGNVGIGTASPVTKLNVASAAGSPTGVSVGGIRAYETTNNYGLNIGGDGTYGYIQGVRGATTSLGYNDLVLQPNSGNLGIGVTPSAWSGGFRAMQLPGGSVASFASGTNLQIEVGNAYYQSSLGTYNYFNTGTAPTIYRQFSGSHNWYTAPSGTAGNAISFTQAMTLDSSGNLGIGTASPVFANGSGIEIERAGAATLRLQDSSTTNSFELYVDSNVHVRGRDSMATIFYTADVERMRISSAGDVGIGTASPQSKFHVDGGDFRNSSGTLPALSTSIVSGEIHSGITNSGATDSGYLRLSAGGGTTLGVKAAIDIFRESGGAAGVVFYTSGTERGRIDANGNTIAGGSVALATNATNGFLYVPTCAGTPTGTPTAVTGMAPIVVNTTNNKLYFYSGGAWRDAGP